VELIFQAYFFQSVTTLVVEQYAVVGRSHIRQRSSMPILLESCAQRQNAYKRKHGT